MIQAEGRRLEKFGVGRSLMRRSNRSGQAGGTRSERPRQISVSHAFSKDQADKILAKVKDRFRMPNASCTICPARLSPGRSAVHCDPVDRIVKDILV
ncbi:MAG: hypothetical protein ACLVJ6_03270 [Merdibacter sp.]